MTDEVNPDRAEVDRDPAEDGLLADLRRALPPDPVPDGLVARAEALFTLRDLDRELAALLESPATELVATRGSLSPATRMSFRNGDGTLAVEVRAGRHRLDGQVLAGTPTEVTLEDRAGPLARAAVDELGRFSFSHDATGPGRLRLRGGPEGEVLTGWFLL
jgi:hypothetical protein